MKDISLFYVKEGNIEKKEYSKSDLPATLGEMVSNVKIKIDIPRYLRVTDNNAVGYDFPPTSTAIKNFITVNHIEDAVLEFDYEFFRYGWAAGSNYYGKKCYVISSSLPQME